MIFTTHLYEQISAFCKQVMEEEARYWNEEIQKCVDAGFNIKELTLVDDKDHNERRLMCGSLTLAARKIENM